MSKSTLKAPLNPMSHVNQFQGYANHLGTEMLQGHRLHAPSRPLGPTRTHSEVRAGSRRGCGSDPWFSAYGLACLGPRVSEAKLKSSSFIAAQVMAPAAARESAQAPHLLAVAKGST